MMVAPVTEFELESEYEGEYESEEFFRRLASLARQAAQSPAMRRVGLAAARTALSGLGDVGGAVGGAPGTRGAAIGRTLGGGLGSYLSGLLPQAEFEWELEGFATPVRRISPDALMEHLGHAAAEVESEAEAEAFIGALIPLAARLVPQASSAIMRAAPGLIRGLTGVTRTLRSSPTTRPLVRTVPTIARRTATSIARQAAQGRPVTPQRAVRTLARQASGVLGSPHQCVTAYQRSRALDRRYHGLAGAVGSRLLSPR